jgi:hypothetical protein
MSKTPGLAIALALIALSSAAHAAERDALNAALAQAARDTRLDQIDDDRKGCGDSRRVEDWLNAVAGDLAKSIRWTGGRCQLVDKIYPPDSGTNWCGQAVIGLKRGKPDATVEVFFEQPDDGKPGAPYAFRALAETKDGPDYIRETYAFELNWKQMHVPGFEPPPNQDCN